MALELTTDQVRTIARLRRRWPRAEFRIHRRTGAVIIEVREDGRTLSLTRFDAAGHIENERRLAWAA
ncbi:MAG TPA: hypothetical protein VF257_04585 [Solirubrobacteraceae bacterium]